MAESDIIFTPDENDGKTIFTFGSNTAGIHGAGAALEAVRHWGAKSGIGVGRTGKSYAIPTKDHTLQTLPLHIIKDYVNSFVVYASEHLKLLFLVTAVGTGLAGYTANDIAPTFARCPMNCVLPGSFIEVLAHQSDG